MKLLKICTITLLLCALLGGCGAADAPEPDLPVETSIPPVEARNTPIESVSADAFIVHYGSFEAAMEASDVTVRAVAGETMGVQQIACGPQGSEVSEYAVTGFTAGEVLWGDMQPGSVFEVYQPGSGFAVPTGGPPLVFDEGEEFILCLYRRNGASGMYRLITPLEGAYTEGDCGTYEGEYNYQPYTYAGEPFAIMGEIEWEMGELLPADRGVVELEIGEIRGPFPITGGTGTAAEPEPAGDASEPDEP